ncbi:response regulator transcription factor [Herbaspirillum sp. HC18]|nr:response regulator transcription factor [Herbaspirillum sp. HC18]
MANIVIVEDNLSYAEDVADYLIENGHEVFISGTAESMWNILGRRPADVILLDLGLPDDSGFNIIPRLRELYPGTGILVLTARVMLDSRILGLHLGADNYLTKPIKFPELAAHIEALCRRVGCRERAAPPVGWMLNKGERKLQMEGAQPIDLTEKEFKLLHMLALSSQPIPRDSLMIGLGGDQYEDSKKMDMLVYRLRKKVKAALGIELPLRSAYGEGYSLSVAINLV